MASGGKRTAGERVLESKHVIGLFLLMLLFSGVFFSLGYVMGRNQIEAQARLNNLMNKADSDIPPKPVPAPKKSAEPPATAVSSDPATAKPDSNFRFYDSNKPAKGEPHLEPAPKPVDTPPPSKPTVTSKSTKAQPQTVPASVKTSKTTTTSSAIPTGPYVLQVAALLKQDDALAVASSLQKKHYACYVQPPQKDKYYRVQVAFKDRKSADAAKQGLENEGFKAFYVKH
jgi:cell division septation protein DedD